MKENELVTPRERQAYLRGYRCGFQDGLAAHASGGAAAPTLPEMPIEALGLSSRPRNCLLACQCLRVGDVAQLSEERIRHMRNLGKKGAAEIAQSLRSHGLFGTAWDLFLL